MPPFHLAMPCHDLAAVRAFYGGLLGCREGRSDATWVDFDFFGHQLVFHVDPKLAAKSDDERRPLRNDVDGHAVPIPHFGAVLPLDEWRAAADRLAGAGVRFEIEPYTRFAGQPGEQGTLFLFDPSGNAVELKGFADVDQLFAA